MEGWDYIGQWSGVPLRAFLERVGADLTAKYVAFKTADDYPSSIDMASALHPQTLLATRYAGQELPDPYGYPLRLRTAVKLGFKNPKWIMAIEVTNTYPAAIGRAAASTGSPAYERLRGPARLGRVPPHTLVIVAPGWAQTAGPSPPPTTCRPPA